MHSCLCYGLINGCAVEVKRGLIVGSKMGRGGVVHDYFARLHVKAFRVCVRAFFVACGCQTTFFFWVWLFWICIIRVFLSRALLFCFRGWVLAWRMQFYSGEAFRST